MPSRFPTFLCSPSSRSRPPRLVTLRVERWTLDPYASITMLAELPIAFAIDTGRLRIDANGIDAAGTFVIRQ